MRNLSICLRGVFARVLAKRQSTGVLLACLLAVLGQSRFAQALDPNKQMSQYIHEKWGVERGFLGGAVYAICQSADGYLWIGTERGLVRFDGLSFTLIQRPLPNAPALGPVRGLVADVAGNLWIRLDGPHLLLYRDGKFDDAFDRFGMQELTFTAMARDIGGGLILSGLSNRALLYRDGKFQEFKSASDVPGTVISLAQTRDGRIWLGTRDDGLFRADQGSLLKVAPGLADTKVNALLAADSGGLWIGTDAGLEFWDGSELVKTALPVANSAFQILALGRDREANVWVGTNHGLIRVTPAGVASVGEGNSEAESAVTAVFVDHDGAVWFGGPKGIERLRDGVFTAFSQPGAVTENDGPVYIDSEGRTWFAPVSGGLMWRKDERIERVTVAGLKDDVVYSISGGGGEIWVGRQRGGLTVLTGSGDSSGDSFKARTYTQADGLAQNSVSSVHRNRDGTVWAGTVSAGISRLRGEKFDNYALGGGLSSNEVNSIVEGYDETMWFATPNGLDAFIGGRWKIWSMKDGLPTANVRTIFEDSEHVLWVATSGGLACLKAGSVEVPGNLPEALHEQIFGMAEDKRGLLWIATSDHVLRVNRERLISGLLDESDVQSYGISDGLQGMGGVRRDRSVAADGSGRIWISEGGGLAVADTKLTLVNSAPVAVRMQSMAADGVPVDWRDRATLAARNQNITFYYVGTNLSVPDRIRYRYKLENSDRDWSDIVAFRQVIYNHLGPGNYRFRVVASNSEGLWNGPETDVEFVIKPALWQTWWFRVLMLTTLVLTVALIFRLRMYQLTRGLNVRFQERLAERTRIAQDLHDTLLQGFISAQMQLDVAEDQLPEGSSAKPALKRILRLMGQVTEEGRNALHGLRRAEEDDRSLELAFSRMRQELAIDEKVGYRVIVHSAPRVLRPLIRDEVYRIGREALVNAFLHAHAEFVEVEVEYASRYLRILVRDDGCGIDPGVLQAGREGHWGLPGMRERSQGIGAGLRLRSRVGAGTEVELTVPSGVAFADHRGGAVSRWMPWLRRERREAAIGDQERRERNERS